MHRANDFRGHHHDHHHHQHHHGLHHDGWGVGDSVPNDPAWFDLGPGLAPSALSPAPPVCAAPEPAADCGLAVELGGHAWASGIETGASGNIMAVLENLGSCTIAFGDATFSAAAHGGAHGPAAAGADTFLAVTGADVLLEFTCNSHVGGGCVAAARSETQFLAIDIHGWAPAQGPLVLEAHAPLLPAGACGAHALGGLAGGNVAGVVALAEAMGAGTTAATVTDALTVENQFSMVSGVSITAA